MSTAAVGDEAWRTRERARLRREWLMQGALLLVLLALVAGVAQNVAANLEARQIKSGFGFLRDPAGFNIGELLFDYRARDSYLRAFAVGMSNTLRVSIAGVALASVLGVVVGLMRLSHHGLVAWLGSAWVEVFRNTPLLIQLLTIYLLATELLPDSSAPISIDAVALLSKQGLQIAVPAEERWLSALPSSSACSAASRPSRRRGAGCRSAPASSRSQAARWRRAARG
jgi:general L-amino acid transport system permease protein